MDKKDIIFDYLGESEIFCQLAEKAAELGQAALEYRETYCWSANATPATRDEAYHNLVEEVADVTLILRMLGVDCGFVAEETHEVSKVHVLEWLAKEAAELSKAALKCRRAYGYSRNVTPVTREESHHNLAEKVAEVMLSLRLLGLDRGPAVDEVREIMDAKVDRWYGRLYESVVGNVEVSE